VKPRLKIFTALSALLLAATLSLGFRSYQVAAVLERRDLVTNDSGLRQLRNVSQLDRYRAIISSRGTITWAEARYIPLRRDSRTFGRWIFTDGESMYTNGRSHEPTFLRRLGFVYYHNDVAIPLYPGPTWTPSFVVAIPYWVPALCFALAPAVYVLRRLRAWLKSLRRGLCPECGYDLRATPNQCPECGRAPRAPTVG
jgi:hypothetical protein